MKQKNVRFQKKNEESLSIRDFFQLFPSDDACLEHVFKNRYGENHVCPKCERAAKWYRIQSEQAFSCQWCGHHIHPMVDTPFESTHTPLQLWFYAIYLFTTSRHGVSAKELERQLGVTYKTAWRMGHEIRKHMAAVDGDPVLENVVEIDETLVGGARPGKRGRGAAGKTILFGMMERDGDLVTEVVPNVQGQTLLPHIQDHVSKDATIHTDELTSYNLLKRRGFKKHKTVNHGAKEYARGDIHVNGVESFWKIFKDSVRSTHMHVSAKHLRKYAKEFEFRHNNRHISKQMFPRLVSEFLSAQASPSAKAS